MTAFVLQALLYGAFLGAARAHGSGETNPSVFVVTAALIYGALRLLLETAGVEL